MSGDKSARTKRGRSAHRRSGSTAVITSIIETFEAFPTSSGRRQTDDSGPGTTHDDGFARIVADSLRQDAAPSPAIHTSRSPSRVSNGTTSLRRLDHASSNFSLKPPSIGSRQSSWSGQSRDGKQGSAKSRYSAESWIRQVASGERISEKAARQRPLRRVTSRDALRQDGLKQSASPPVIKADPKALSRIEGIIVDEAPQLSASSAEWLCLADAVSEDEGVPPKPPPKPWQARSSSRSTITPTKDKEKLPHSSPENPARAAPTPSLIPTRKSSLLSSGKRASPRNRENVAPPKSIGEDRVHHGRDRALPDLELTLDDLDEEDSTVKRIKELREQHKTRIQRQNIPAAVRLPSFKSDIEPTRPASDDSQITPEREIFQQGTPGSAQKAYRLLGLQDGAPMSVLTDALQSGISSPERMPSREERPRHLSRLEELVFHDDGLSASSGSPELALEYSYSKALQVLGSAPPKGGLHQNRTARERSSSSGTTKSLDLPPLTRPQLTSHSSLQRPQSDRRNLDEKSAWSATPPSSSKRQGLKRSMTSTRRARDTENQRELGRQDSIEMSVLRTLQAPRLNRKLSHPATGRVISYSDVGDPTGKAVFVCAGMGLTRYVSAFYEELASTLRLRLITVDRPGVGGSEPYPQSDRRGPLAWPDDIFVICQHLGIKELSLLAHSAGTIYALAVALTFPELIRGKIHLLAPWIPPSQLQADTTVSMARGLPRSQRLLRVLPPSFLKAANSSFMTATSSSTRPAARRPSSTSRDRSVEASSSEQRGTPLWRDRSSTMLLDWIMPGNTARSNSPRFDGETLATAANVSPMRPDPASVLDTPQEAKHTDKQRQAEFTSRLTQRTWELATRDSNPATDLLVCLERNRDIGFRYTDVRRQLVITHGTEDKRVPLANVKWLVDQFNVCSYDMGSKPRCELRVLPGEGHGLMASAPIMGGVLTELAGY